MDSTVVLADGRLLAIERYGQPGGTPVFFFHGYPGSRRDYRLADPAEQAASAAGVEVVAISRPGYDSSTDLPGRRIGQWPADVLQVADELGWETFAVIGYSGGGPYALACAHAIAHRISGVACVAPVGPPGTPGMRRSVGLVYTTTPQPVRTGLMWSMSLLSRFTPDPVGLGLASVVLPQCDRDYLKDQEAAAGLMATWRAAFANGTAGAMRDATLYSEPWGFSISEISIPVSVWHGDADVNVLPSVGESVAASLLGGEWHLLAGEGHVSVLSWLPDILAELGD